MNINATIRAAFPALIFSILSACSIGNFDITPTSIAQKEFAQTLQSLNLKAGEKPTVVNVGNGKPGGSFAFKVNFKEGFKIKNNTPGTIGLLSKINSFKVALIDGSTAPSPGELNIASNSDCGGACGPYTVIKTTTSPASLILTNVPAGVYYVAVAAYQDAGASIDITTSPYTLGGSDNYAVSTTGGDTNAGKITINSVFQINPTASANQMGVNLTLQNGIGATIENSVTATAGGNSLATIQKIRFYLVDSNAASLTQANIKAGPFDSNFGAFFSSLTTGPGPNTAITTFTNVPSGTYYIAAAAYNSSTVSAGTNITTGSTNITIAGPTNLGTFAISNSGGDGGPTPGRIVVNADQSLATFTLNLPLTLQ